MATAILLQKKNIKGEREIRRWWFRNPANSPVNMENIQLFTGFLYIPGGCLGFLNHQQYVQPTKCQQIAGWKTSRPWMKPPTRWGQTNRFDMCHGQNQSRFVGDGRPPTWKIGNPYFMGPYKPLRNWVDEFIPYYVEIMGVDRPWHIWYTSEKMT